MKASLAGTTAAITPFPHASVPAILERGDADAVLAWLEADAPWRLRVESFYEQYEFSLLTDRLPPRLDSLISASFVDQLRESIQANLHVDADLLIVDISAHKLMPAQTIRVHNDFVGDDETHRVLIQLNAGWSVANGGLLMLFGSEHAEDIRAAIMPTHGSGFIFEISRRSFHAVSTIKSGRRYTLVYTFRAHRS